MTTTPPPLWPHPPRTAALQIVAVICGGLALDITLGWPGQHLATVWAVLVWAWLFRAGGADERRVLILCTVISAMGEVFLSLIWGLYDYRFGSIPLFVPPGHALLMTLGLLVSRHLNMRAVWLITTAAALWAIYVWVMNSDRFGVLLFGLYGVCMVIGRERTLYATMFVLALTMELYGTSLGNWAWKPEAPWLHLSQHNPPFSAGAFYCTLDLLVLAALTALKRVSSTRAAPDAS